MQDLIGSQLVFAIDNVTNEIQNASEIYASKEKTEGKSWGHKVINRLFVKKAVFSLSKKHWLLHSFSLFSYTKSGTS